ncbi:hypothetical protein [Nostoc linckia]|uniref:hypothetical protein n=1 Tax=Nostoc linckia TaxID=92942 RepID=UPI000BFFA6F9|nr:hypothetical protein [Nostoc linckia]
MEIEIIEKNDDAGLPDLADLRALPTDDLKKMLADAVGVTAKSIRHMARIWQELEARGEDMSNLRTGLMCYMPAIADGRLHPELLIRCAGQTTLLRHVSLLPLEKQADFLQNGLPVARRNGDDGKILHAIIPLENVTIHDIRVAFAGDSLRDTDEQTALLVNEEQRRRAEPITRGVNVTVRLTRAEYEQLRESARQAGKRVPTYARDKILN